VPAPAFAIQVIARNIAPLVGVLLLGWNPRNLLYLFFIDTLLAMAVILAGLVRHFSPPVGDDGWAARLNGEAGALAAGAFIAAIFAIPLGVWIIFMLDGELGLRETFADRGFLVAAGWQALAALSSYVSLLDALERASPEELHLKRRFAIVFLRWFALIFATQFTTLLPTRPGMIALVAVYAVVAAWTDLAPDHFLKRMPDLVERDAPAAPVQVKRKRRRR
jgi:hypothetical protein